MLLSTNRHVGLDLQAELDDARAEIQDLREHNAACQRELRQAREIFLAVKRDLEYEQTECKKLKREIADLRRREKDRRDSIYNREHSAEKGTQTNQYTVANSYAISPNQPK